jgi:hypothetical protein
MGEIPSFSSRSVKRWFAFALLASASVRLFGEGPKHLLPKPRLPLLSKCLLLPPFQNAGPFPLSRSQLSRRQTF